MAVFLCPAQFAGAFEKNKTPPALHQPEKVMTMGRQRSLKKSRSPDYVLVRCLFGLSEKGGGVILRR